jgi:hypothetical protein
MNADDACGVATPQDGLTDSLSMAAQLSSGDVFGWLFGF